MAVSSSIAPERTSFVGRTGDVKALRELVKAHRLVSVTGPPGVGKSRLVAEVIRNLSNDSTELETHMLDVSEVPDVDELLESVAEHLDVEAVRALVVLDGFEHLVAAAASTVEEWLNSNPELRILVTSREPLALAGERVFYVRPMPIGESSELFFERAQAARHDFDPGDPRLVEELVERLDGLPLEIELAAARMSTLTPAEVLRHLDRRFEVLRSTRRGQSPHVLKESIERSIQTLDESHRFVLAQSSVFEGGFDLQAAESVLECDGWVPDAIAELMARSLITKQVDEFGESRFSGFESVHSYLGSSDPVDDALRLRHAQHFARAGKSWVSRLNGRNGADYAARLQLECANLRAAFEFSVGHDAQLAAQLAATLDALFKLSGVESNPQSEEILQSSDAAGQSFHRQMLERCVDLAGLSESQRADVLGRLADLHLDASDFERAAVRLDEALELDAEPEQQAWLEVRMADVHRLQGDLMQAIACHKKAREHGVSKKVKRIAWAYEANCWIDLGDFDRARECLRAIQGIAESTDLRRECEVLRRLVYVQFYLENVQEQRRLGQAALAHAELIGDERLEGICLQGLADADMSARDYEAAIDSYTRALSIHRKLGNRTYEAMLLGNLGGAYHRLGDFAEARRRYHTSLGYHRSAGTRAYENVVLFALGALEFEERNYADARDHFRTALEVASELELESDMAGLKLCLSWVDIVEGGLASAANHARLAAEQFEAIGPEDHGWMAVALATLACVNVLRGQASDPQIEKSRTLVEGRGVDSQTTMVALLTEWCTALSFDDPARTRSTLINELATIRETYRTEDDSRPIVEVSLHARMVESLVMRPVGPLQAALEDPDAASEAAFAVGPDSQWFQVDDEPVDLRRRKSIRLILNHLVELHTMEPGQGCDVYTLFDVGWPGEQVDPDAGARRVYWAIRTLRKNGLDELILTSDDGYLIDPNVQIAKTQEW